MENNFQFSVDYTLKNEGGFVNNPRDPGGATNWGITAVSLAAFRNNAVTTDDVKALQHEEAYEIYHRNFWKPLKLGYVNSPKICTAVFDIAVNRGISAAVKYAQEATKMTIDDNLGEKTLAALNGISDMNFIVRFATIVQHGYVELALEKPEQRLGFLPGWSARAMRLLTLIDGVVL